jgi:dienelactone hydrolase
MLPTLTMLALLGGLGSIGAVPKLATPGPGGPVLLVAGDGVQIYAASYAGPSPTAPVILLFHQADSSKNEYAPIAPQLVKLGYNVLAIDQRSGGDMYPPTNETVQHLGRSTDYIDVLPDMDAALAWAQKTYPGAPIYAWGSSYSAALVFAFAAKHPLEIAAVLSFSPGEYLPDKHFVKKAARHVRVPVFIDSSSDAGEEQQARAIFNAVRSRLKVDYAPKNGVHGSSTLRPDRDPGGADENWAAVTAFLAQLKQPASQH